MSNIAKSILGPRLPTDGFDPDVPYQFIELRRERPMGVRTFDFKSLIEISNPGICRMSNFKIVRQEVPNITPVPFPGPGTLVSRMALPASSYVTFSLHGLAEGRTFLKGRDQRDDAEIMPGAKYTLEIAVHPRKHKQFATCYVFDRINRDIGRRIDFTSTFKEINDAFEQQAALTVENIDAAKTGADVRTVTLDVPMRGGFEILTPEANRHLIEKFEEDHPGVLQSVDALIVVLPVPMTVEGRDTGLVGLYQELRRASDDSRISLLLISSIAFAELPGLTSTMAHEMGHFLGLHHLPEVVRRADIPESERGKENPDPDAFPFFQRTLMYPFTFMRSLRLNRVQIELMQLNLRGITQELVITI
ncbi:hypothetical protein GCM10007874_26240 [Labrys miyagiensis]|uniref:Peptidase M10 metallopeptidase domain-containing protein n=1 Tax=Labrys miyagiensis TaxID=346912 RepID=A0ABQ6CGZ3_9HYPH|nr:hypothetical protein [Labrys miyagiensis]GLS19607.1 hypothetical protein GCM10007874_26240 [Labrys miyagiensis]